MPLEPRSRTLTMLGITCVLLAAGASCNGEEKQPVNPTDAVFADFARRIDAYIAVRKQVVDSVGELDPTTSQAEIASRATALANGLVAARPQAKQGDIFTTEIASVIATLIREEYRRRPAPVQETREDHQEELPDFVPRVNELYPTTYPLATFPPALLPLLPPLPDEVEYRIVRSDLVLRDIEANLIIDVMPDAVPQE